MDEDWLLKAAAYVELNPVNAGLVKNAWDYRWSCVHAHVSGKESDGIILPEKLLSMTVDWKSYLQEAQSGSGDSFEQHERTGRPLGAESILEKAERSLNRVLNCIEI